MGAMTFCQLDIRPNDTKNVFYRAEELAKLGEEVSTYRELLLKAKAQYN